MQLYADQATTQNHYDDVIMGAIASQITSLTIVYSTVYSGVDQSSASLAFVWGIHRRPVNSPHKWPVTRKMFPFDDVIMIIYTSGCLVYWRMYASLNIDVLNIIHSLNSLTHRYSRQNRTSSTYSGCMKKTNEQLSNLQQWRKKRISIIHIMCLFNKNSGSTLRGWDININNRDWFWLVHSMHQDTLETDGGNDNIFVTKANIAMWLNISTHSNNFVGYLFLLFELTSVATCLGDMLFPS